MTNTANRWAVLAFDNARKRAGTGWTLLGVELREALVCRELVAIFAGQEVANGDNMRAASELVVQMFASE